MSLPKVQHPVYSITLPISGKLVSYRPFQGREEKILLLAKQSEDRRQIRIAIQQILGNCTEGSLDVVALDAADSEYLFLQIVAKSQDEIVTLEYDCSGCSTEQNPVKVPFLLNLTTVDVHVPDEALKTIQLDSSIGVQLKYPDLSIMDHAYDAGSEEDELTKSFELMTTCIESVYTSESVYNFKDYSKKEQMDFVESLSEQHYVKMQQFFRDLPRVSAKAHIKCNSCGKEEDHVIEDIINFFILPYPK